MLQEYVSKSNKVGTVTQQFLVCAYLQISFKKLPYFQDIILCNFLSVYSTYMFL